MYGLNLCDRLLNSHVVNSVRLTILLQRISHSMRLKVLRKLIFNSLTHSTTNVCETTNQHRGFCQGSRSGVQMLSHRGTNPNHNLAERWRTSTRGSTSYHQQGGDVEYHRSETRGSGTIRVFGAEHCWRSRERSEVRL